MVCTSSSACFGKYMRSKAVIDARFIQPVLQSLQSSRLRARVEHAQRCTALRAPQRRGRACLAQPQDQSQAIDAQRR